jgi:hypothetical protein
MTDGWPKSTFSVSCPGAAHGGNNGHALPGGGKCIIQFATKGALLDVFRRVNDTKVGDLVSSGTVYSSKSYF